MPEPLPYTEQLYSLINKMRTAYWLKRKGSSTAAKDEHKYGLEIDKLLRAENARRRQTKTTMPWKQ